MCSVAVSRREQGVASVFDMAVSTNWYYRLLLLLLL